MSDEDDNVLVETENFLSWYDGDQLLGLNFWLMG